MKKTVFAVLALSVFLTGCGMDDVARAPVTETTADTTEVTSEEEVFMPLPEINIDDYSTVEDYFGGEVYYEADLDGDGEIEECGIKVAAHGTQCYVESITVTKENGEKIEVEHPKSFAVANYDFYRYADRYELNFGGIENHSVPFGMLKSEPSISVR